MNTRPLGHLTAAELHICIKNGSGMRYLCSKYDCLEDQLVTRIKRMYKKTPKKAQKLLANLRENDRKINDAPAPTAVNSSESNPARVPNTVSPGEDNPTKVSDAVQIAKSEPQPEVRENEATDSSLKALAKQEADLSEAVRKLELQHRDVQDLHRNNLNAKRDVLRSMRQLECEITELGQEYEDLCLESDEQEAEMKRINTLRREKAEALAKVREQMNEARKVVIFVCDDETISAPDSDVALDDSGYEKISSKLIRRPECRRLAVWEIELLARVIRVTAHMEGLKLSAEFVFENQQLEEAYRQLVAHYETVKQIAALAS